MTDEDVQNGGQDAKAAPVRIEIWLFLPVCAGFLAALSVYPSLVTGQISMINPLRVLLAFMILSPGGNKADFWIMMLGSPLLSVTTAAIILEKFPVRNTLARALVVLGTAFLTTLSVSALLILQGESRN